jgi:hypothetical protein
MSTSQQMFEEKGSVANNYPTLVVGTLDIIEA